MVEINDKPIRIVNVGAIRLAKQRALREGRTAANAASQTIVEALGDPNASGLNSSKHDNNTAITGSKQ